MAGCFALLGAVASADPAVKTLALEDLHIYVPDPAKAGEWYVKHLGALPTSQPHRVSFGRFLIIFSKADNPGPSTLIDHLGLSYPDLDAKLQQLVAAGAKITTPAREAPGLFKLAFIDDPFGVRIEVVQDPELLGIHHVHLRVPDPEATLRWYEEVFGGTRGKLKGRIDGLMYSTIPEGYAGVSRSAKGGQVWLLAAKGDKLERTDDRVIYNLAFMVEDLNQAVSGFKSKGAPVERGEPRTTTIEGQKTGVAFTRDPNGVLIELLQREKQPPGY
jgi:catechol 2,3-dioxygenase-like lactoylglutathione lyase family enzyme